MKTLTIRSLWMLLLIATWAVLFLIMSVAFSIDRWLGWGVVGLMAVGNFLPEPGRR